MLDIYSIWLFFSIEMQPSLYITEKLTVMFGSCCLFPCSKMKYYYYSIVSFCSIILQTPFNSYFTESKTWMLQVKPRMCRRQHSILSKIWIQTTLRVLHGPAIPAKVTSNQTSRVRVVSPNKPNSFVDVSPKCNLSH